MSTKQIFYGKFNVDVATADLRSRITIAGSENADGVYEIERNSHQPFPLEVDGQEWSIMIETLPLFAFGNQQNEYSVKELFQHVTHSPTEGFVTMVQTIKPHFPIPGEIITLKYVFRTALRLVYLREALKPTPPDTPFMFTYDPRRTRVVGDKSPGKRYSRNSFVRKE